jgi:hypothetical protein
MMIRKLDRIEKELGYCETKLEKERHLRRQLEYLHTELAVLEDVEKSYRDGTPPLSDLPYAEWGRRIAKEREWTTKPGPSFERAKRQLISAGILDLIRQEKDLLTREIRETSNKFHAFVGFEEKREVLAREKSAALQRVSPQVLSQMRRIGSEFKRAEEAWNAYAEDAIHFDEAMFFLSRHVDYHRSCRSFLVAAKGSFDLENWMEDEYVDSLFRHSNIGRAKEMLDGAHRNWRLAQKELVCVGSRSLALGSIEPGYARFLDALFDDVFLDGRLQRSIAEIEQRIVESEATLRRCENERAELTLALEASELSRVELFQRLGDRDAVLPPLA